MDKGGGRGASRGREEGGGGAEGGRYRPQATISRTGPGRRRSPAGVDHVTAVPPVYNQHRAPGSVTQ